jgi:hypothetical protein
MQKINSTLYFLALLLNLIAAKTMLRDVRLNKVTRNASFVETFNIGKELKISEERKLDLDPVDITVMEAVEYYGTKLYEGSGVGGGVNQPILRGSDPVLYWVPNKLLCPDGTYALIRSTLEEVEGDFIRHYLKIC